MNAPRLPHQAHPMSRLRRVLGAGAACVVLLGGCGGGSDEGSSPDTSAESGGEVTSPAIAEASAGDGDEATSSDQASDQCERFTAEDFEAVTGVAAEEPDAQIPLPRGVIAVCDHQAAEIVPMISVTFHESSNWDDFIEQIGPSGLEPISVDGGEAYESADLGFFFQPDAEDWYLQIGAIPGPDAGYDLGAYSTDLALEVLDVVMDPS